MTTSNPDPRVNAFIGFAIMYVVMAAILIVGLSSCALLDSDATPMQKYTDTQEAYILLVEGVLASRDAGLIEEDKYQAIYLPLILEGDVLLDRMKLALESGDDMTVELLRSSLLSIIIRLQVARQ